MKSDDVDFELSGGALAPDFVNTKVLYAEGPRERIPDYGRLLEWAVETEILSERDRARLARAARAEPARAHRALAEAYGLRSVLFDILAALADGKPPSPTALDTLNVWVRRVSHHRRLGKNGDGFAWTYGGNQTDFKVMLWPVVDSASEILLSDDLRGRLRRCGADHCDWIFLDFSRRQNRRWCDMATCGNREKAKRHYARVKGGAT
jgi:predicted RNA-binding Zn ribbon-like protein